MPFPSFLSSVQILSYLLQNQDDKFLLNRIIDFLPVFNIKWMLIRMAIGFKNQDYFPNKYLDSENNLIIYEKGIKRIDYLIERI